MLNKHSLKLQIVFVDLQFIFQTFASLFIIISMKAILLFFLVASVISAPTYLVVSSLTSSTIIYPPKKTVVLEPVLSGVRPDHITGSGAKWIFDNSIDSAGNWPTGYTATVQALFYADCQAPATLVITGDNSFTAYVNGIKIGTGDNWDIKYTFPIDLKCGLNNLTAVVLNGPASPQSIIFAVSQDQSTCYVCKENGGFYSRKTCSCQCAEPKCHCPSLLQRWVNKYPICGCECPNIICSKGQYLDQNSCKCKCTKVWCPEGQVQSQESCACVNKGAEQEEKEQNLSQKLTCRKARRHQTEDN